MVKTYKIAGVAALVNIFTPAETTAETVAETTAG